MTGTARPQVSVVIPAFNQARYLPCAVESALAQDFSDLEIIVIDDGSTDDTPGVVGRYGGAVRYVRQANRGLACARNAGIRLSRAELVALLDADDMWLPGFLEHMLGLAARRPRAAAYYSAWRYIDSHGRLLPEPPHAHVVPPGDTYRTLLKANFIVPSTVVLRRPIVASVGGFDERFRRLQDWELWIRLSRQGHELAGSPGCYVQYRLHEQALSADHVGGEQAALALAEKHFGPDDGRVDAWPPDKRRAYGGVYRYHALLNVRCKGDVGRGAQSLRRAIEVDPALARDRTLYDALAWSGLPLGHRRLSESVDVDACARPMFELLNNAFGREYGALRRRCDARAHTAVGAIAYGCGHFAVARRHMWRAVSLWPPILFDAQYGRLIARLCLGARTRALLKRVKARVAATPGGGPLP